VPTLNPTVIPTLPPETSPVPVSESQLGDVNGDNVIDIVDALLIAQFYVGLIKIFPVENISTS
jgi:hypothetical protein